MAKYEPNIRFERYSDDIIVHCISEKQALYLKRKITERLRTCKLEINEEKTKELSYDQGFSTNQYNGNIAGIKWKSGSDGVSRAYGYNYDKVNRLTVANFTQQNSGNSNWTQDKIDFSVGNLLYDANGNIASMTQKGMVGSSITTIDHLSYSYQDNSNKLMAVSDTSHTAQAKLGDFNNGINTGDDYSYDANGNMVGDQNKGISTIIYNHLNLPSQIAITGKGTISYQYDAAGNKLKKTVVDNTVSPARTTVTDYVAGFVYRQDSLEFTGHEEGRIRPVYKSTQPVRYVYDYFEKDHLGNIRVVLGTQTDTSVYAATMETTATEKENALFSNIDNTRAVLPSGYPADATTNPNQYVAKLNANTGTKIGPSLVLRVMAGDNIQLGVKAYYQSTTANTGSQLPEQMLAAILSAFSSGGVTEGVHAATGAGSAIANGMTANEYQTLKTSNPSENLSDKPKAYLNYALFDDQFNMVNENSGVKQVQGNPGELQILDVSRAVIKKTGFLYIYTSNESGADVFFDNLVVVHNSGPLLEETHYYPYGLTMKGISSIALKGGYVANKLKYNEGSELQTSEFLDDSGLESYITKFRMLDPQLGKWWQVDPKPDYMVSPYSSMNNNPIRFSDFLGDTIINNSGANVSFTYNKETKTISWSDNATEDIRIVGDAMSKTEIGLKLLEGMASATHDISMKIDKEKELYTDDKGKQYGEPGVGRKETTGYTKVTAENGKVRKAEITIFQKALERVSTAPEGKIKFIPLEGKKILTSKYGVQANMGATTTHEATHATQMSSMRTLGAIEPEKLPHTNEFKYYMEFNKDLIRD